MAGDWIPMRLDLTDDPAVIAIAAATGLDQFAVVGRLFCLWSWANRHLSTGVAGGISDSWIDRYVSTPGFAAAMLDAGWLRIRSGGVEFPNFDRWNSEGAKRRVKKTLRKRVERARKSVAGDTREKATIPRAVRKAVYQRDGFRCVNCQWAMTDPKRHLSLPSGDRLSIDHVTPECQGGQTIASNLVTLCMKCNQEKSGRTFEQAGMSPNLSHLLGDISATREEKRREEIREEANASSCPESPKAATTGPLVPSEPPLLVFPCVGRGPAEWPLTRAKVHEWQSAFPALDVLAEARKARQWLLDNPTRRKTFAGMSRFIGSWLGRAQDNPRPASSGPRSSRTDYARETLLDAVTGEP